MHIYIIFTKFKLCAGAFKRVRNRHVTFEQTWPTRERDRYTGCQIFSSYLDFGFSLVLLPKEN